MHLFGCFAPCLVTCQKEVVNFKTSFACYNRKWKSYVEVMIFIVKQYNKSIGGVWNGLTNHLGIKI